MSAPSRQPSHQWAPRPRQTRAGLAVVTAGNGPLVVMLHGVGLRAEAWAAQIDGLAKDGYRILAPDMPGHGESAQDKNTTTLLAYADRIAPLLTEPAIVIGHSMGALLALELAQRRNLPIRGITAVSPVFRRNAEARHAVQARAASLDGHHPADPSGPISRWFGQRPSPEATACSDWLRSANPSGYKSAYTVFASADGPDEAVLAALPMPALFLTGTDDPNSTPAMARALAQHTRHGEAHILPGAHMLPMTHPTPVTDAVRRFLRITHPLTPHSRTQ